MGEVFFKRLVLVLSLLISLFLFSVTGFAAHPLYPSFSSPESSFTFNNNLVSVSDTAVYRTGYYSVSGGAWQSFSLSGNSYNNNANWLSGSATKSLPGFGVGEHYVIIYSCTYSGGWNCHESKWQLFTVNNLVSPSSTCFNGLQDANESGVDCGVSCGSSCPKYLRVFYVSNSSGNDSWNGLAPAWNGTAGPWKTTTKVNSAPIQPGDAILFKRGDTWMIISSGYTEGAGLNVKTYSGTVGNPITYGAYGEGAKPIITGRQTIAGWNVQSNWTSAGTNIWSTTLSLGYNWAWTQNTRGRIWINGVEVQKAQSTTVPTALLPWTHNGATLYVYSAGNPASVFTNLEWGGSKGDGLVQCEKNYITFQNLDLRGSEGIFQITGSNNIMVEDCNIGMDTHMNGLLATSSNNVIIRNSVFDTGDRFVDAFEMNNAEDGLIISNGCSNFDIYNNTFRDWGHTSYNFGVTSAASTNIKFHHNFLTAPDIDYGRGFTYNVAVPPGLCTGNEIYNNYFYDHPTSNQISGDGLKFYNNIIDKTRGASYREVGTGLAMGTYTGGGAASVNNEIYNNIIMNSAGYGIKISYSTALFKNNSFRNNLVFNNGLKEGSGHQFRYEFSATNGTGIADNIFQNNLFYRAGQTSPIFYEKNLPTRDYTVAEFNAKNGGAGGLYPGELPDVITNNIGGDPLFVDATNSNYLLRNYHLSAGSPAIRNGIGVGLLTDYVGNNYNNPPSIGAFEYTGSVSPPQSAPNCSDEIKNGNETGIDCGGNSCSACVSDVLRNFYISPSGVDDVSRNGSAVAPWKSLSYACSRATTVGDLIHVTAGNYNEASKCTLAIGVSIVGEGNKSHIISTYATVPYIYTDASISLTSDTEGTNGNQTISYLLLDGNNFAATKAIVVRARSNVKIHNIDFVDFKYGAVYFSGKLGSYDYLRAPAAYATGNEIYNSTTYNCGERDEYSGGHVSIAGQEGTLIHDNVFKDTGGGRVSGDLIDGVEGYNKGVKIYNNKFYQRTDLGSDWNFHMELWNVMGGFEIYNNEFYDGYCAIDHGGHFMVKGNYNYSTWIHDNLIKQTVQPTAQGGHLHTGINVEGNNEDVIISNNRIVNYPFPVYIVLPLYVDWYGPKLMTRINVYNNIMENIGYNSSPSYFTAGVTILSEPGYANFTTKYIHIYNNIMNINIFSYSGVYIGINGIMSNMYIKNNIIQGSYFGPIAIDGSVSSGTLDTVQIQNNLYYNNGNSNNITYLGNPVITNLTESNNLNGNPLFVGGSPFDYHLRSGSPAIGNGTNVGLLADYEGNAYTNPPSIGVYR